MIDTSKALSAADIDAIEDLEIRPVAVPEWGGRTVYLREVDALQVVELGKKMGALAKEDQAESMFMLLGATLCDEKGALLYESLDQARERLGRRKWEVLLRLKAVAEELLGKAKKAAEESVATTSAASPAA